MTDDTLSNSGSFSRMNDRRGPPSGGRGGDHRQSRVADRHSAGPSARAAVPWYVGEINEAPPGHKYFLYLPFWKGDNWNVIKEGKQKALKAVGGLPDHVQSLMHALADRQRALGTAAGAEVISAENSSPFATGLGWEHPNENGFAFLHPYGLPYLPGSGVKGVVRRATEELALFGEGLERWTMLDIWWLFGFEGASGAIWEKNGQWAKAYEEHRARLLKRPDLTKFLNVLVTEENDEASAERLSSLTEKRRDLSLSGALRFFDVIPELAGMDVDIMNPHYGKYYQGDSTPHDASSPVPIFFLVIPPESKFTFVVDCPREHHLPGNLRGSWRELLHAALKHAFDWIGFGAKTAVGYGAMQRRSEATDQQRDPTQEVAESKRKDRELQTATGGMNQLALPDSGAATQPIKRSPSPVSLPVATKAAPRVAKPTKPAKPSPALPPTTKQKEWVTLAEDVKGGKAKVRTKDGHVISCTNFPYFPQGSANMTCRADITREAGKPKQAVFKGWK